MIAGKMKPSCDSVAIEPFEVHPGAYLGFMKFQAVSYLVSTTLFLIGGAWRWLQSEGITFTKPDLLLRYLRSHDPFA